MFVYTKPEISNLKKIQEIGISMKLEDNALEDNPCSYLLTKGSPVSPMQPSRSSVEE